MYMNQWECGRGDRIRIWKAILWPVGEGGLLGKELGLYPVGRGEPAQGFKWKSNMIGGWALWGKKLETENVHLLIWQSLRGLTLITCHYSAIPSPLGFLSVYKDHFEQVFPSTHKT